MESLAPNYMIVRSDLENRWTVEYRIVCQDHVKAAQESGFKGRLDPINSEKFDCQYCLEDNDNLPDLFDQDVLSIPEQR